MTARLRLTVDDYSVLEMALRNELGIVEAAQPTHPDDSAAREGLAAMRRRSEAGLFRELAAGASIGNVAFQITEEGRAALAARQASPSA